jgi:(p)ppGpp synthase/HD superfamily hydrolase
MATLVEYAAIFSKATHMAVGQVRKYTGEPYHTHPVEVAKMVDRVGGNKYMIAAALLHDVVEDTHLTLHQIRETFGPLVAQYVYWLSDLQTPEDGNRATRKQREREKLAKAPPEAQTIKLADLIHNSQSIFQHDPDFARVYLKEKRAILKVMTKGNEQLYLKAWEIVNQQE